MLSIMRYSPHPLGSVAVRDTRKEGSCMCGGSFQSLPLFPLPQESPQLSEWGNWDTAKSHGLG